jgi:hypothetical protein
MERVIDVDGLCVELHGRCVELHDAVIELDDLAYSKDRHFLPFLFRIGEVVTELDHHWIYLRKRQATENTSVT